MPTERKSVKRVVKKPTTRTRKTAERKTAPQKLKLLITIVNREKADFYMDLLQSFEVNMQFCALGRGTAGSELLHVMGLEDNGKAVIFSIIREDRAEAALAALDQRFQTIKKGKGIAYTVPMSGMIGVSLYSFFCNNRKAVREDQNGSV
ncbi:MAG: hypothetical protein IKM42_06385 [Clostridia bacterium]|nr:hypothetical protein [Clostridia bacterium]